MAYLLELTLQSKQSYIQNIIISIIREFDIKADVTLENEILRIVLEEHKDLENALERISKELSASLFLKSSTSELIEQKPKNLPELDKHYPLNIGLCPACQKEMFDVSSKRYYYPFTSCSCCGGNYSFLQSYPYERKNTSLKYLAPCSSCETEVGSRGRHEAHHTNSCHNCGVPVRLVSKNSERYANDAGSFRTMFEVAAKAIADNKRVLIKTTFGYRIFYVAKSVNAKSILMMIDSNKITDNLALISEEFQALLSIERPLLNVTLKTDKLKEIYDANTAMVKYPDEGFSILLGVELMKLGLEYVVYEETDAQTEADFMMEYDLEINHQSDMQYFLNKDRGFIVKGERVSFPSTMPSSRKVLSVTDTLVGVVSEDEAFFDTMEHFENATALSANILEGIKENFHSKERVMQEDESSFLSVIAEHNKLGEKYVGAYFDDIPSFLYYDGKNVLRIVPPKDFVTTNIIEDIKNLREGSERLVEKLENTLPQVYKKLITLQEQKDVKLFELVAIILGLEDKSFDGVTREAMKFVGKGGIQIDTHVKDNRFDYSAFLASIISYQLAGVSSSILSYSIFESFGDYFSEIVGELQSKTKVNSVVLCGSGFANQSLFSRVERNFKLSFPLMNKYHPIGKESCVVGGIYL